MIALVTRGSDDTPLAIHRSYLSSDGGDKAPVDPQKMMLGPCRGGAVRLGLPGDVLMVGEGVENCLTGMQATGYPAWAAMSTSGLRTLDLPADARDVIVLADGDDPGEAAARDCSWRWMREGPGGCPCEIAHERKSFPSGSIPFGAPFSMDCPCHPAAGVGLPLGGPTHHCCVGNIVKDDAHKRIRKKKEWVNLKCRIDAGVPPGRVMLYATGMTSPERVHKFLTDRTPAPVCDDCIAKHTAVEPRQQVNPITATLGLTTDFDRKRGTCSICKSDKLVTRSLRHV